MLPKKKKSGICQKKNLSKRTTKIQGYIRTKDELDIIPWLTKDEEYSRNSLINSHNYF